MNTADYIAGLTRAHEIINEAHEKLIREHHALPPLFGFFPRRRHHEIMGASRILKEIGWRIVGAKRSAELFPDAVKEG